MWSNTRQFLTKAGTTIFCLSVLLWALAYFPRLPVEREAAVRALAGPVHAAVPSPPVSAPPAAVAAGQVSSAVPDAPAASELISTTTPAQNSAHFFAASSSSSAVSSTVTSIRGVSPGIG